MSAIVTTQNREWLLFLLKACFEDVYVMENCKAIDVQRLIVDKTYHAPAPYKIIPVLDISIVVNFKNFSRFVEVVKGFSYALV